MTSVIAAAEGGIPFDMVNGLIVVEAEVNGKSGNYILDSGANGILLNAKAERSEVSFQAISEVIEGSETPISSIKVGGFERTKLWGFATDLSNIESYVNRSLDGILGCAVFTPNSLMFDFNTSELFISQDEISSDEVEELNDLKFRVVQDLPLVEVQIDGSLHTFILDSGASSHFVDKKILEKVNPSLLSFTGHESNIITAGKEVKVAREFLISDCRIGDEMHGIRGFEKDFTEFSKSFGTKISGLLSLSQLSTNKVYFDLKSNRIFL